MPNYTYSCNSCNTEIEKFFSIPEFLQAKSKIIKCEACDGGELFHKVNSVSSIIERATDQIILDIQEEVQKTVNKINNGNQRVLEDVYGDRANPYKNNR
jgi:predicted nucleic acid-binding Zn ribbon protein